MVIAKILVLVVITENHNHLNNMRTWLDDRFFDIFVLSRLERRRKFNLRQELINKFGKVPEVGDIVCDCRFQHLQIVEISSDSDSVKLGNEGYGCSLLHCCSPVPHPEWEHPED